MNISRKVVFLCLCSCISWQLLRAQTVIIPEEQRFVYQKEYMGSFILHSNGWGFGFKYNKQNNDFKKYGFEADMVYMKHPKENKRVNSNISDARPYVFGKKNSLIILRTGYAKEMQIFDKAAKDGVQIHFNYSGGISTGFLKPVYLEILKEINQFNGVIAVEKYDENKHSQSNIIGGGPALKGFSDLEIFPLGGYLKTGLTFDFSSDDERIKALNLGICLDIFAKKAPIFTELYGPVNKNSFISFYAAFTFGKKS